MLYRMALILLLSASPVMAAAVTPEVLFEDDAVSVSGVTPGGSVGWATVSREFRDGVPRLAWAGGVVADEDGDGAVELATVTPQMAVWLAVDLESGAWAEASPPPWRAPELSEHGRSFQANASGRLSRLSQAAGALIVMMVRPGTATEHGVWEAFTQDNGPGDQRVDQGVVELGISALRPVGASPPGLEEFRVGDVVLLVHPRTLASAVSAVGPANGTSGQGGQ